MPLTTFKTAIVDYFNNEFRKFPCSFCYEISLRSRICCFGINALTSKNLQFFKFTNWYIYAPANLNMDTFRIQQEIPIVKNKKADILLIDNENAYQIPNTPNSSNWMNWYYKCTKPFEVKYYVIDPTLKNFFINTIQSDLDSDFVKWQKPFNSTNYALSYCYFFGNSNVTSPFKQSNANAFISSNGGKFLFVCDVDPATGKSTGNYIYEL